MFLLTKQIVSLLPWLFVNDMGRASLYLLPGCQFKRGPGTHSTSETVFPGCVVLSGNVWGCERCYDCHTVMCGCTQDVFQDFATLGRAGQDCDLGGSLQTKQKSQGPNIK